LPVEEKYYSRTKNRERAGALHLSTAGVNVGSLENGKMSTNKKGGQRAAFRFVH
jgi:hypothetical protein